MRQLAKTKNQTQSKMVFLILNQPGLNVYDKFNRLECYL